MFSAAHDPGPEVRRDQEGFLQRRFSGQSPRSPGGAGGGGGGGGRGGEQPVNSSKHKHTQTGRRETQLVTVTTRASSIRTWSDESGSVWNGSMPQTQRDLTCSWVEPESQTENKDGRRRLFIVSLYKDEADLSQIRAPPSLALLDQSWVSLICQSSPSCFCCFIASNNQIKLNSTETLRYFLVWSMSHLWTWRCCLWPVL